MSIQTVSLANLGDGSAVERFNYELQRVLNNISDPNTEAKTPREVTLKVKIKPNIDRDFSAVTIEVRSKLAAIRPVETSFHLSNVGAETVATEYNPKQEEFEFNERKM
ncbi:MAG TPA: hypothetical protein VJ302_26915 [Blastocatellia bacterium]|nr:hypothetical protein [Blastocatellia bacterium]